MISLFYSLVSLWTRGTASLVIGAISLWLLTCPEALAKAPASSALQDDLTGWFLIADMTGSFNLPGARVIGRGGYQWRLYHHDNRAFSNNFIRLGGVAQATPANIGGGANLSLQPASFVRFGVNYSFRLYFPAFNVGTLFQKMEEVRDHFAGTTDFLDGEARVSQQRDVVTKRNGHQLLTYAHVVRLHWLLQLRVKGIVAQWLGAFSWWFHEYNDIARAPFIYESGNDIIMARRDQLFNSLALLGYEWQNLRFLVVSTYDRAIQSGEEALTLGPALQWTVTPQWKAMKNPFFLFVVRWWIRHRFRTGAMPNLAIIFQTNFDV